MNLANPQFVIVYFKGNSVQCILFRLLCLNWLLADLANESLKRRHGNKVKHEANENGRKDSIYYFFQFFAQSLCEAC